MRPICVYKGIKFLVTRGSPQPLASLENRMTEVRGLYADKFGHSVDQEFVEEDGI